MEITVKSTVGDLSYEAVNERGDIIQLSGRDEGFRPMENLLASAAACSTIDVEIILAKMRQKINTLEVEVRAKRREDRQPASFESIHLHFILSGELKESKVQQAIEMSLEKYCSVTHSLRKEIEITSSYKIVE